MVNRDILTVYRYTGMNGLPLETLLTSSRISKASTSPKAFGLKREQICWEHKIIQTLKNKRNKLIFLQSSLRRNAMIFTGNYSIIIDIIHLLSTSKNNNTIILFISSIFSEQKKVNNKKYIVFKCYWIDHQGNFEKVV